MGQQGTDFRIIDAQHAGPVKRNLLQKLGEGVAQGIQVGIKIDVLVIDVGHHGDGGRQVQEGAVAFVGLGHQMFSRPQDGVGAHGLDLPADDDRGIQSAGGQDRRHQAGGGGLAVGAGHGDAVLEPHQFGQHFRPADDGNPPAARGGHFAVGLGDGRGPDHHVGALDVARDRGR